MKYLFSTVFILILITGCDSDKSVNTEAIGLFLRDSYASWSPDGKTIAFSGKDDVLGGYGIYLIDTNGANKILFAAGYGIRPDWSPDSRWIVFDEGGNIFKKKVDSGYVIQLTYNGGNFFPSWSPDGEWIAFDRSINPSGILIMKTDGSEQHRIGGGAFPRWHPNNKIIIATVGVSSTSIYTRFVKLMLDPPGSIADSLIANYGYENYFASYSNDGSKILFNSGLSQNYFKVWIMDSDNSNITQLTQELAYWPDWSPDGERIVYTNAEQGNGRLWIMNKDGSNKKQITP